MLEKLLKKGGLQELVNKRRKCSTNSGNSISNRPQNKKTQGHNRPDDDHLQRTQKKFSAPLATAILAIPATEQPQKPAIVAKIAKIAVAGGGKTKKILADDPLAHDDLQPGDEVILWPDAGGVVDDWLARLQDMRPMAANAEQAELIERLIDLTRQHGQQAADMGWSAVDLYGVAPHVQRPGIQRRDANGLFVSIATSVHNYRIDEIGPDGATLVTQTGARHDSPRQRAGLAEAIPIWEIGHDV